MADLAHCPKILILGAGFAGVQCARELARRLPSHEDGRITLRVPKADTPQVTSRILAQLPVLDLTVEDPPIEEVIEQVFAQEKV